MDWLHVVWPHERSSRVGDVEAWLGALLRSDWQDARPRYGYERARSAEGGALLMVGGDSQRGTALLSLPAAALDRVRATREGWAWLEVELRALGGAGVTRVDLAVDWLAGEVAISDVVEWYTAGLFGSGGRQPSSRLAGDWLGAGLGGRTLYVGKREHGKMFRAYEKGRQLGDAASCWLRLELELRAVRRAISTDVVTWPERYFAGAAPNLPVDVAALESWRLRTRVEREGIVFGKLLSEASRSYGRLVDYAIRDGCSEEEVIGALRRPGRPRRLDGPRGSEWQALIDEEIAAATCAAREEREAVS